MNHSADPQSPLQQQGSELHHSTSPIDPLASPLRRNQHRRQTSPGTIRFADELQQHSSPALSTHAFEMATSHPQGLGINRSGRPMSIGRVPVGGRGGQTPPTPSRAFFSSLKSPNRTAPSPPTPTNPYFSNTSSRSSPQTPGSAKGFLSPSQRSEPGNYAFGGGGMMTMLEQDDNEHDTSNRTNQSFADSLNVAYGARDDPESGDDRNDVFVNQEIVEQGNGSNGNFIINDNDKTSLLNGCPAKHDIHSSRKSWLSVSILMLSIYSTVFSGIYLVIALVRPRYGRNIHTGGRLSPSTASTLFALFAKTIELSFVTVFVTFLGQVLSRRSLVKASRGVTIAELTMRTWVIQPGFMITHWQTLQHAGLTVLGVITLTAAFVAMFYTTASDALVSPHLKYGGWQNKLMYGLVKTSYANAKYVANSCQTPITLDIDPGFAGTTCLSVLHAGQAQHNHITFLDTWTQIREKGEGISSDLSQRPQAPALMFDNTTVTGSWILTETSNMTAAYLKHNRIINNVSMAMPHAGVIAAAHHEWNAILQPEELDGVGEYSVRAAVVSPAVNVLCVNMNVMELEPLIYVRWPNANTTESNDRPGQRIARLGYEGDIKPKPGSKFLNKTVVDDIFEWGPKYNRQPPVFPMFPIEYNSLVNISVMAPVYYLRDSIYLLIKAQNTTTEDYTLCQIRSFLSPSCSTHYNVSGKTGGKLMSHCEDPNDNIAYHVSVPDAPPVVRAPDWRDVGSEWITSMALGTGISNANASAARLISQFVIVGGTVKLNPLMPTIAESLAVMAGSTLLLSSTDATFNHSWDYMANILEGTELSFNASLASQEFTSGPTQPWQSMFYLVLLLVFCTNVFCLIYFFMRSGLVTDYTEPQNLFALAVNSPPSRQLNGSCGAGPEGDQFNVDWHVSQEDDSGHFFIKDGPRCLERSKSFLGLRRRTQRPKQLKHVSSYSMLSSKRRSWL